MIFYFFIFASSYPSLITRLVYHLVDLIKTEIYLVLHLDHLDQRIQLLVHCDIMPPVLYKHRQCVCKYVDDLLFSEDVAFDGLGHLCLQIGLYLLEVERQLLYFLVVVPVYQVLDVYMRVFELARNALHCAQHFINKV